MLGRPSRAQERRETMLPRITEVFGELGYRRATTAALAERCGLQETQLYRLWPSKKAMFLAVIDHLYDLEVEGWNRVIASHSPAEAIDLIFAEEARHRGRSGLHRITLAALSESDDAEVREAVRRMYRRFHRYIRDMLKQLHPNLPDGATPPDPTTAAWAIIGLGTLVNIGREFDLFGQATQVRLINEIGAHLAGTDRLER